MKNFNADAFLSQGLVVPVTIGLSSYEAQSWVVEGYASEVPNPVDTHALIDTGVRQTLISEKLYKMIGLDERGYTTERFRFATLRECPNVRPEIMVAGKSFITSAIVVPLTGASECVIGRNFLEAISISYDGPSKILVIKI